MKKPKVIYHNKADNNNKSNLDDQKFDSATRSRSPVVTGRASLYSLLVSRARSQNQHFWSSFKLVLHRLFFKKKDILGLYSYKLRVFLKALLSRRCSSNGNNYIKNARNIRAAGIASSFLLVLLGVSILIPIYNKTNNVEATTGTSKQSDTELSITTSSNVAGVDLLVKDNNGTFASSDDSGNTLGFNVTTNNYTGYTLTIASPDNTTYNNGKLTNTDTTNCTDATKCVLNTISKASNTITTNGTWGYKPSSYCTSSDASSCSSNTGSNSVYLPSPTTTATTLNTTSCPNKTSTTTYPDCPNEEDSYTIDIAARADYTQPAGVYSNTYILQAIGNDITYKITFASYTSDVTDAVSNLPTALADSVSATKINLINDKTPTRTGYTFSKWCLGTTSSNGTVCNGTTYEVGTTSNPKYFGIDQTVDNSNITLYAVWTINKYNLVISADSNVSSMSVKAGSTTGASTTCTKSGTTFTCSSLTYGISYYLYPVFASGYEFNSWAKTDSATNAQLGSTTAVNTYYKMGDGAGALTLTSKSSYSIITFKTSNATSISLFSDNSLATKTDYTNNQTVRVANGTYYIYGNFPSSYMFSSWTTTAGTLLSPSSRTTTLTVSGDTTLTLTGRSSVSTYTQDFTLPSCQSLASSADYTIIDRRDNNRYTVRYINGACWMTQNLRLAGNTALTSTDSNISSNYTVPTTDLITGDNSYTQGEIHNSGNEVRGYWYNYCAASAGTVCNQTQASASYDICPKNWHLAPTSSASTAGDFKSIASATYKPAFSPIYGGFYISGSLYTTTTHGYWWSSTAINADYQYNLQYNGGILYAIYSVSKAAGLYARCVLDNRTIADVTYMQDVTSTMVANTANLAEATLIDRRDGSDYTVKKNQRRSLDDPKPPHCRHHL